MGNTQINGNGILAEDDGSDTDVKPTDTNAEGIDGADEINKKVAQEQKQVDSQLARSSLPTQSRNQSETICSRMLSLLCLW